MTTVKINYQPSGGKCWAARVTGRDPRYGLSRDFLPTVAADRSSSGKTGSNTYELAEGELYEIHPAWQNRYFATVREGEVIQLSTAEALALLPH